jgi:hypothetical protein
VADQLRRLLPGWTGIAAGIGSWTHRSMCAGVAGRAIRGVPERDQDRGDRPVSALCLRDPGSLEGSRDEVFISITTHAGSVKDSYSTSCTHLRQSQPTLSCYRLVGIVSTYLPSSLIRMMRGRCRPSHASRRRTRGPTAARERGRPPFTRLASCRRPVCQSHQEELIWSMSTDRQIGWWPLR